MSKGWDLPLPLSWSPSPSSSPPPVSASLTTPMEFFPDNQALPIASHALPPLIPQQVCEVDRLILSYPSIIPFY